MKIFGKWLVYGNVNGKKRMAAHFRTKADAIEALDRAGFEKIGKEEWKDRLGQTFTIEKNKAEY